MSYKTSSVLCVAKLGCCVLRNVLKYFSKFGWASGDR